MRYILEIGLNDFLQRDVLIAVAGLGVLLLDRQLNGFVGAGMDTGQTRLTMSRRMPRLAIHHMDRAGGAHLLTNPTTHAAFCHAQ